MRNLSVLLVSLAACGGGSKSTSLGHTAGAGGPPGPPPSITWTGGAPDDGGSFQVEGLPAVSDDGDRVLVGWQMGDGGRGYPNLRLVVVDRADQTLDTRVVLDADAIDEANLTTVDVAPHNQFLTESNQAERWRPLAAATVADAPASDGDDDGDSMYPSQQTATLGDVEVRFDDEAHLVIAQGGKVLVDTVKKDWRAEKRPMYEGAGPEDTCSNPSYLGEAYVDVARRLAVIGVEYRGNDACWEPSGEYHVVTW